MTRAAINILGDGSIIDITSLGKSELTVEHPGPGQYLVHGTLGMAPPPEGWGFVINAVDAAFEITTEFVDGLLTVSARRGGEPEDLQHSITLHVLVEDLPEIDITPAPEPVRDPLTIAQMEIAALRAIADAAVAPLQDAVDIDDATPAEVALLKEWKRYRVALNRLPEQPGYPAEIDWPAPPA